MGKKHLWMTLGKGVSDKPVWFDLNDAKIGGGIAVVGDKLANKHELVLNWTKELIDRYTPDEVFFVIFGYDVCGWDELVSEHSDYFWSRTLKVDNEFETENYANYQKLLRAVIYSRSKWLSSEEQARSKRLLDEVERTFVESEYNSTDFLERLLTAKHLIVINENIPNKLLDLIKLDDKNKKETGKKLHLEEEYRELLETNMSIAREAGVTFINTTNTTRDNYFPRSIILSSGVKIVMRTQPANAERFLREKYTKGIGEQISVLPDELAYLQVGDEPLKLMGINSNGGYIIQDFQNFISNKKNNDGKDDNNLDNLLSLMEVNELDDLKDVKIELTARQLQKLIRNIVHRVKSDD